MNKTILSSFILLLSLSTISCKTDVKKASKNSKTEKAYSINQSSIKIGWTAYKTTDKVAVKGEFTKVNIKEVKGALNIKEALDGLEFSIPASSIFSNNEERDTKLKKFFFGVMDDTELLTGTILTTPKDNKGQVVLKMNGIAFAFPIDYIDSGNEVSLTGVLNMDNWNGKAAIESLDKACFDLHKGEDGISKTWSEVKIDVSFSKAE